MIIQLRGTNGSGKTWIVKQVMNTYEFKTIVNRDREIMGYYSKEINLFVVGRYTNSCGGCDNIHTQDEICARIYKAASKGWNVLFEGLLPSHLASRFVKLYKDMQEQSVDCYFIFLTTPLEQCYENIMARRKASGRRSTKEPRAYITEYNNVVKSMHNMEKQGVPKSSLLELSAQEALYFITEKMEGWE